MTAQQTLSDVRPSRSLLLGSIALAGGVLVGLIVGPTAVQSAPCAGQNTENVICNNVTTNNVAERTTTNGTDTTVLIGPGFLDGFGLHAVQVDSEGSTDLTVTNTGSVTLTNAGANGLSVLRLQGGADGGAVTYDGSGNISNTAATPTSTGLYVTSFGAITITNSGSVTGGTTGIKADSFTTGPITVTNTGTAAGTNDFGIETDAVDGATTITNSGNVSGGLAGISAVSIGAGPITINNTGTVTGGNGGISIFSDNAPVEINTTGTISGTNFNGIGVDSLTGSITVRNSAAIQGNLSAISTTTISGLTTIINSGTLTSFLAPGSSGVISVVSSGGAIEVTNTVGGVIRSNANSPGDLAITTSGGPATINNAGTLTGRLFVGGSSNVFNNSGTWSTSGTNTIGGNFNNSGTVNLGSGAAIDVSNFLNFGTVRPLSAGTNATISVAAPGSLTNASTGSINLQNGFAGDRLTIGGNYVGVPGSQLRLDFATQTGTADQLLITGNASGSTAVSVLNLTPLAPFTTSPNIVQVNGTVASNTFTLGTLQNFGALDVVLVPGTGDAPGSFALSLGVVPSVSGLSGVVALQGAQTLAFQSNSAVLDQVSEARDLQRRGVAQGVPLGYAQEDPQRAYAASLPNVMKAPRRAAPVEASPPRARLATWARVYGDIEERDNFSARFTFAGLPFVRDLSYDQRGGGLLAGADVVLSNLTSSADALIIGAFGGYTTSNVDFKNAAVDQEFSGGTVGAKATYVNGGFFADAIVKTDLLSLDIVGVGLAQSSDLTNVSVLGNIGYKFDLTRGFYIEPTVGAEYVRTDFSGSPVLTANTVPLIDGHATRVRAGARFGTEWVTNNVRIEPSILPLIYLVADASGSETFTAGGPGAITFPNDEGKVFGEVQASVNFFDLGSGLSGFVRGDVRFGEDLLGGSGKAGVRYTW